MERILLSRTDRIGDVILTTPAISAVREKFPGAKITFLATEYTKPLLENNLEIDEVLVSDKPFFSLVKDFKKRKFNAAIIFFVQPKVVLATYLAKIPLRIGPASKPISIFLNQRIWQHRSKVEKHEADYNLELVKKLGASSKKQETKLFVSQQEKLKIRELLKTKNLSPEQLIIGIHPGGKGSAPRWPQEYFAQIAELLEKELKAKIVLTGNKEESVILEKIASKLTQPLVFNGNLLLKELIALISEYKLLITNSTGPLHIAVALGVPTVSFFSPIRVTSPVRWGPYTLKKELHTIFRPEIQECKKCIFEECKYFNCMKMISVEKVVSLLKQKITFGNSQ